MIVLRRRLLVVGLPVSCVGQALLTGAFQLFFRNPPGNSSKITVEVRKSCAENPRSGVVLQVGDEIGQPASHGQCHSFTIWVFCGHARKILGCSMRREELAHRAASRTSL